MYFTRIFSRKIIGVEGCLYQKILNSQKIKLFLLLKRMSFPSVVCRTFVEPRHFNVIVNVFFGVIKKCFFGFFFENRQKSNLMLDCKPWQELLHVLHVIFSTPFSCFRDIRPSTCEVFRKVANYLWWSFFEEE